MIDCLLDDNYGVSEIQALDSNEIEDHESEELFQAEWSHESDYLPGSSVEEEPVVPPPSPLVSGLTVPPEVPFEHWRK